MSRGRAGRCAALAVVAGLASAAGAAECRPDLVTLRTASGPVSFAVEIADEDGERARGLMFRESMPREAGMLFLWPDAAPRAFWMKNTRISLDMIFIGADGVVCGLVERATPLSLEPRASGCRAQSVLEINGGLAAELGIAPGVAAQHPAFGAGAAWPCPAG